ncbi:MAG: ROK family protein [Firmicutes bacterium]|nr:ROK family protein [Bacillota bacterium]
MYRGRSGSAIKSHNRSLLLRLLLLREPLSRVELASITGLTIPTVHGLTKELMKEDIVCELGTTSPQGRGAGRKASLLGLKPKSKFSIGIDLGVRTTRVGLLDIKGAVVNKIEIVHAQDGPTVDESLDKVFEAAEKMIAELSFKSDDIVGIGVGVPGLVNVSRGFVHRTPNLGWERVPIRSLIEKRLRLPVVVDNNIRAMACGERMFGQGREEANLISFFVGPGVGAGILINDRIFRGAKDGAGEVGHTLIDPSGPICRCGRRGCLEAVASNTAVLRRVRKIAEEGLDEDLRVRIHRKTNDLDIEDVISWSEQGNMYCRQILKETGRLLGEGVANLINLFNPELIIVGGQLFESGDLVFAELVETARQKAFSIPDESATILKTEFGKNQGVVGAGALALKEFFYSADAPESAYVSAVVK